MTYRRGGVLAVPKISRQAEVGHGAARERLQVPWVVVLGPVNLESLVLVK